MDKISQKRPQKGKLPRCVGLHPDVCFKIECYVLRWSAECLI